MRLIAAVVLFGCLLASAQADEVTTGELELWCAEAGRVACGPYIMGVAEAPGSKAKFCTLDAKRITIIEAVIGQMKIQPPSNMTPAGIAVADALGRAFPCKN